MRSTILSTTPTPTNIYDSHCHLQLPEFDNDRGNVIERAKQAGIKKIMLPAIDLSSAHAAIKLAQTMPDYFEVAVGNHPYSANQSTDDCMSAFSKLIESHPTIVTAIGETGLDYFRNDLPAKVQIESFIKHLELAKKFDLHVIIHTRETDTVTPDALKILQEQGIEGEQAIFHCFSGSLQTAEKVWAHGHKTSFTCNLTYSQNSELLNVFNACPPHLRLLETDSPYLSPQSKRGQRNEPANLAEIASLL